MHGSGINRNWTCTNTEYTFFFYFRDQTKWNSKSISLHPSPHSYHRDFSIRNSCLNASFIFEVNINLVSYNKYFLHLTFHCRDVNSKRAAITALDSYRQIFVCKKSIEYALIWIIKFGNQTFFPSACYGSLFCLCMEIQRSHAKKCFFKKKKKEKEKLKKVVNH